LDPDERLDLIWVCERLRSTEYYDLVTADIQSLHGILAAIASDGIISVSELEGLSEWLEDHDHLRGCWPYEEVGALVTSILNDKRVDESESRLFQQFCREFVPASSNSSISQPMVIEGIAIKGLCAVCPEIQFQNSVFCFTGESSKYSRQQFVQIVEALKGTAIKNVTQRLDYLVIGAGSNPCWAYACYGRKVEKAVELRKMGFKLLLIHENDFLDAALGSSQIREQWSHR
jgi:NAD-dependent DNA ligase